MINLQTIDETNFLQAAALRVSPEQTPFMASAPMILARAYAYRNQRTVCWGIYNDDMIVGLALVHDMAEEPAGYHLCEFLIDQRFQGRGYGAQALRLILDHCRREGKFPRLEVCVRKENAAAIHVYESAGFRDSGYQDSDAPDSICMVYSFLRIHPTTSEDLLNVQRLWADPEVMHFVGFPEGLRVTMAHLEGEWLTWVQKYPVRRHYSIYDGDIYCGETFYDVDETGLACMDIKLLLHARRKGIASFALSHALDQAFLLGGAKIAWVDPNSENLKALKLYDRLGFCAARRPSHLEDPGCDYVYMELSREDWQAKRGLRYRDIILRDLREGDVEDEIRWNSVETAWMDWDGPDLQSDEPFDIQTCRQEFREALQKPRTGFRKSFELDTADGRHIGTVSCYPTGGDFQHLRWKEAEEAGEYWYTLGISICESGLWSKGLGTQALATFCLHFLNHGKTNLRLQTWSGNVRMVRCAEKVGFVEVNRFIGNRHIRGRVYDGLTFQLDLDKFHKFLTENP